MTNIEDSIAKTVSTYNIGQINKKLNRTELTLLLNRVESRKEKYETLETQVSHTPFLRLENSLPNGNILYIKLESESAPGYSHYMRVYLDLIRYYESSGIIRTGQRLYDFTSGNSGIAMAAVGSLLGYRCEVGIPAGGEKAREKAILEWIPSEQLHFSNSKDYVAGAATFNRVFLKENKDVFFLNHSCLIGKNKEVLVNNIAIDACAKAVDEISGYVDQIDTFVAISGNGTTQYGYGRRLNELYPSIKIYGLEAFESGFVFEKLYPGVYAEKYGLTFEDIKEFSRHRLPGTTFPVSWHVPAIDASLPILSGEILVGDKKTVEEYKRITDRKLPEDVVRFDEIIPPPMLAFGRTTRAGYCVAKKLAGNTEKKSYLIFSYDRADRYDSY